MLPSRRVVSRRVARLRCVEERRRRRGRRRGEGRGDGPRSPQCPDPVEKQSPRSARRGRRTRTRRPADGRRGIPSGRRPEPWRAPEEAPSPICAWEQIHTQSLWGKSLCAVLAKGEGEGAAEVERRQPFASDSDSAPVLTRPAGTVPVERREYLDPAWRPPLLHREVQLGDQRDRVPGDQQEGHVGDVRSTLSQNGYGICEAVRKSLEPLPKREETP